MRSVSGSNPSGLFFSAMLNQGLHFNSASKSPASTISAQSRASLNPDPAARLSARHSFLISINTELAKKFRELVISSRSQRTNIRCGTFFPTLCLMERTEGNTTKTEKEKAMKIQKTLAIGFILTGELLAGGHTARAGQSGGDVQKDRKEIRADRRDLKNDLRDVRADKKDVRGDHQDLQADRKDLKQDIKNKAGAAEIKADRRDIRSDVRDVKQDKRDIRNDKIDLRRDVPDLRRDKKK
jgi:hypothetical protein